MRPSQSKRSSRWAHARARMPEVTAHFMLRLQDVYVTLYYRGKREELRAERFVEAVKDGNMPIVTGVCVVCCYWRVCFV